MTDSHTYPRDFFLYLLATVTLYVSTVSVLILLFQFINLALPDPLDYAEGVREGIRWGSALLAILFPVFALVTRFLHRDLSRNPEKAEYRIRKWLLYLTVFAAALLIIGDLVALLFNFLNGDLTMRFLVKILAIVLVAGLVFGYELWDVRRTQFTATPKDSVMSWGMSAVVLLLIVSGFVLSGSPFEQRRIRFDQQRVSNLQEIQYQVIDSWIAKGTLPASVDALKSPLTGFVPPVDPETNTPYEYRTTPPLTFTLCATFSTTSDSATLNRGTMPVKSGSMDFWDHSTGRVCFDRTIDPAIYRERLGKEQPPPAPVVP